MTDKDRVLIGSVEEMIAQAPSVGLCSFPFKVLRDEIKKLIDERDALLELRKAKRVLPDKRYFGVGVCPHCGAVFVDDNTNYCGNCGQRLNFRKEEG